MAASGAPTLHPAARLLSSANRGRRRRSFITRRRRRAWLFMAPLVAVNLVVVLGPSIASVYYSFTNWDGIGAAHWTGLTNFRHLVHDREYRNGLEHNLEWTA